MRKVNCSGIFCAIKKEGDRTTRGSVQNAIFKVWRATVKVGLNSMVMALTHQWYRHIDGMDPCE